MGKEIKIWFDEDGDYLEVLFDIKPGYFKETENDALMKKIDNEGNLLGFSIMNVSTLKKNKPISLKLKTTAL